MSDLSDAELDDLGGWWQLQPSAPELADARRRAESLVVVFPQRPGVTIRGRIAPDELRTIEELAERVGDELAGDSVGGLSELRARAAERSRQLSRSEQSLAYRRHKATKATESAPNPPDSLSS